LAAASDAIIVGFQVRPNPTAKKLAEQEGVQIKTYSIIYDAIDEIKSAIEGLLQPKQVEKELGSVEIRQVFEITKIGKVAGCFVTDGKINRNNFIRVVRNGIVIYPNKENTKGELASLKRIKDNVMDVKAGFECGLTIKNFDSIQVGDVLEAYEIVEVKQTLEDLRKEAKEAEKVEKD
jgi:translation initiation factor IF-2